MTAKLGILGKSVTCMLMAVACLGLAAEPVAAQFGRLLPRDVRNVTNDAVNENGCAGDEKSSVGSRVLGGIMGRTTRRAQRRSGINRWAPVPDVGDQLDESIACRLNPEEQVQAADATLRATRSVIVEGEEEEADTRPEIGSSASWTSETREDVSGTSTVTSRDNVGGGGGAGDLDCITVTDVIIVKGEETTANKRMCRPPGSRRYSIVE